MATIRAVTGRHLTIEVDVSAGGAPAALNSLRCTIRGAPAGTQLLDQVMTLLSPGAYSADFTATQTAALTGDAAFEICEFDPGDTADLTPLAGGVVLVSRPGDASAQPLTNRLTVNLSAIFAPDLLPGTLLDNGDGTVTVTN